MMTKAKLKSVEESLAEDLKDPEFRDEWNKTALARTVAIEVIKYRAENGLSQTELGRLLGMHQPAVSRLEEGEQTPSIEMLTRLSKKLGIDLAISIHSGGVDVERLVEVPV